LSSGRRGGTERALVPGEKKPLTRRDAAIIIVIAIGVIASFVALIRWDMGRECVRWATRFDTNDSRVVYRTQVCAEFRPRRYGEEPQFDQRSPTPK